MKQLVEEARKHPILRPLLPVLSLSRLVLVTDLANETHQPLASVVHLDDGSFAVLSPGNEVVGAGNVASAIGILIAFLGGA